MLVLRLALILQVSKGQSLLVVLIIMVQGWGVVARVLCLAKLKSRVLLFRVRNAQIH